MHNLRRFWNQNRNQIIKVASIIFFIFIVIQLVNYFAKNQNKSNLENIKNNTQITSSVNTVNSNKGLLNNQSSVTGQDVSEKQLSTATDTIYNFVEYCNNQNFEKAYSMLTDECKRQMYSSIEVFKQAYYNNVFNGQKKSCTIENWVGDIYKVNIKEDILATGKDNGVAKQEYMTIKKVNGENKLNINNYIGYTEINKTTEDSNIKMVVVGKNTYKDYETYTIKVTNKASNSIQLDKVINSKTIYLEDDNKLKYYYYNHELTDASLVVEAGQTKEITIKFYSTYVSTKKITNIVFSNIISRKGQVNKILSFKANV